MLSMDPTISKLVTGLVIHILIIDCMYFTDSGPFFETSIENCKGSLYLYDFEEKILRALAHRSLAYPTGL